MILVDTNIIIDYWKKPSDRITEIFKKEDIAICGVIQAELIHGARSEKDIAVIAQVAIEHNIPLFSNDKHFVLMQKVFPGLKLYN